MKRRGREGEEEGKRRERGRKTGKRMEEEGKRRKRGGKRIGRGWKRR